MIGENLKYYRELSGYSQPDLSKKSGVSHSTISRIEHNKIESPSYDLLVKLAKALLLYLMKRQDNYPCLWLNVSRRPIGRGGIQSAVEKLCKRAGVSAKPGPHTFRHTAAITFLRNGGDSVVLQYMLGHSSMEMTKRYLSTLGESELIAAHKRFSPVDNMILK